MNNNLFPQISKRIAIILAGFFFVIFAAELFFSIRQQSQTVDESIHILSGYQYWKHRDFGANPEHPPLVKLVATLPLLNLNLKPTEILSGPTKLTHTEKAFPFLYDNFVPGQTILSRARLACILFPLILAVLMFLCCYEMYGQGVALLGLVLLIFEPNVLANGPLVTTDLAASCFIFASIYSFYRYMKSPGWWRLCVCGLSVTLAFASKHSSLILVSILVLLAASELLFCRRAESSSLKKQTFRLAGVLAFTFVFACIGLWAFYSFQFAARPPGFGLEPTVAGLSATIGSKTSAELVTALWRLRVLPESFLWGLADVLVGVVGGRATFLLGQVYADGKWFFFPLVFLMKSTLPFLALLAALPLALKKIAARRELIFMTLPPLVFLVASTFSGMNLGIRHILPIFPYLIVLAALSASRLSRRSRFAFAAIMVLILAHAASSLREALMASRLAPDSAEMQAVLCQAMLKASEPGHNAVCRNALAIAQRVYPDYQMKRMPGVTAVLQMYFRPCSE